MKIQPDAHAHLATPLHRWDPRYKLIALLVLIFAFSSIKSLYLVPVMFAVTGTLFLSSRLPAAFLLARLRLPGFFLLLMTAVLPFLSGQTPLLALGPLTVKQEGCLDLLLITSKFLCILTTGVILLGTSPFLTTVRAMRALGLPPLLADMILFSYRYLFDTAEKLKTMQTAMRLRGFRPRGIKGLLVLASLAGTILVRSYEQSERVYKAMVMRGYGQDEKTNHRAREDFHAGRGDLGGLVVILLIAAALMAAEICVF